MEKSHLKNIVPNFYLLEKTLEGFDHYACQVDNRQFILQFIPDISILDMIYYIE